MRAIWITLLTMLIYQCCFGQYVKLVKDISLFPNESSFPNQLTLVNNKLVFAASQDSAIYNDVGDLFVSARYLWALSNKPDGKTEVIKLFPKGYFFSSDFGQDASNVGSLISAGSYALFQSHDGAHGQEVWRTDGTIEGTYLLKDFWPESKASGPFIKDLTVHKGIIYFLYLHQLWRSDGTIAGTYLVRDLQPSYFGANFLSGLIAVGDYLYMNGGVGEEQGLWRSDGTAEGTTFISGSFSPPNPQIYNNEVFFIASEVPRYPANSVYDYFIWKLKVDTMEPVKLAGGDSTWARIDSFKILDDKLYFNATQKESPGDIWVLDLTSSNPPIRLRSISSNFPSDLFGFKDIKKWKNDVWIELQNGLWRIDGNTFNTTKFGDYGIFAQHNDYLVLKSQLYGNPQTTWFTYNNSQPSPQSVKGNAIPFEAVFVPRTNTIFLDNKMYFSGDDGKFGTEIMALDRNSFYTVKDLVKINPSSTPRFFTKFKDKIYFVAGSALWSTDGYAVDSIAKIDTPIKTVYVRNDTLVLFGQNRNWFSDGTPQGTRIELFKYNIGENFVTFNNRLYFQDKFVSNFYELLETDGTESGTKTVLDVYYPQNYYNANLGIALDNGILLTSVSAINEPQLSLFDGTNFNILKNVRGYNFTRIVNKAIFHGNPNLNNASSWDLWVSDGTPDGTQMIYDFAKENIVEIVRVQVNGNYANFIAYASDGAETKAVLFQTDGTPQGTFKVNIPDTLALSYDSMLGYFDNELYTYVLSSLNSTSQRYGIYKKSKNAIQLELVTDNILNPTILSKQGDYLFVRSWEGRTKYKLWKINVKTREKVIIQDLSNMYAIPFAGETNYVIPHNGVTLFTASSAFVGNELFRFKYQDDCFPMCVPIVVQKIK